jgi:hypothetical protein
VNVTISKNDIKISQPRKSEGVTRILCGFKTHYLWAICGLRKLFRKQYASKYVVTVSC